VKLLVVVAYDADNRAYPLCFTIVKKKRWIIIGAGF
jgi:hypothetical protein